MAAHDERIDSLTPREHEVLALVRRGLTNEEIAQRLGISLDGAKYHVSQILSKLGVASREEAAAFAEPADRGSPWRRLAGAAVVAAALAGIAVLGWSVLANDGEEGDSTVGLGNLTVNETYDLIVDAGMREGEVLHSEVAHVVSNESGNEEPFYTYEVWTDFPADTVRIEAELAPEQADADFGSGVSIARGGYWYIPDDPGEALRYEFTDFCPGSESTALSVLLICNWWSALGDPEASGPAQHVEIGTYEGTQAILLLSRGEQTVVPATDPFSTPLNGGEPFDMSWTVTLYVDIGSHLPLAWLMTSEQGGEVGQVFRATYEHEFVGVDDLPADFLDPRSIGYGAEGSAELLDQIEETVPVYWLGDEYSPGGNLRDIVLTHVSATPGGGGLGQAGTLTYETTTGVPALTIQLWSREAWESFRETQLGALLYEARCVEREEIALNGETTAVLFATHRPLLTGQLPGPIGGPLPYEVPQPTAGPTPDVTGVPVATPVPSGGAPFLATPYPTDSQGCPTTPPDHFPAHVFFEDAVVGINVPESLSFPIFFPEYDTQEGVRAVVEALRRR